MSIKKIRLFIHAISTTLLGVIVLALTSFFFTGKYICLYFLADLLNSTANAPFLYYGIQIVMGFIFWFVALIMYFLVEFSYGQFKLNYKRLSEFNSK